MRRGVTGEESGETHDGVGTCNDVTSVTSGDKLWIQLPPAGNLLRSFSVRWKWRRETTHSVSGLAVIPLMWQKMGQQAALSQAPSIPFLLLDAKRLLVCHSDWAEISVDGTLPHNNVALESMKVPLTCLTMSAEDIYNYPKICRAIKTPGASCSPRELRYSFLRYS